LGLKHPRVERPFRALRLMSLYPGLKHLGYAVRPLRGRRKMSKLQAFRPRKDTHNELALKRHLNRDRSQRGDTLLFAFHVGSRFHRLCTRISLVRPRLRPPLQPSFDWFR
jgi:hypothetical protein